jgi:hypothetical protein
MKNHTHSPVTNRPNRRPHFWIIVSGLLLAFTLAGIEKVRAQDAQTPKPSKEELKILAKELQTGGNPYKLFSKHKDQTFVYTLAGLELCPTNHSWGMEVMMVYADDTYKGRSLRGAARVEHFTKSRDYLRRAMDLSQAAIQKHPENAMLRTEIEQLEAGLASASLEAGDLKVARQLAEKQLAANTDTKSWNYGNIIHNANCVLGRASLRSGDKKTATEYLLKAGRTPGSPQLDSFGPDFTLARELLEASEKQVVLDYLDLVAKFWVDKPRASGRPNDNAALLEKWRKEIEGGKAPADATWK